MEAWTWTKEREAKIRQQCEEAFPDSGTPQALDDMRGGVLTTGCFDRWDEAVSSAVRWHVAQQRVLLCP